MTKYSECKHETDGIIFLEDSILSLSAYMDWSELVGVFGNRTICWDCWCDKRSPKQRKKYNKKG